MSDHVDGPRSIGEPAADLTDFFAFTSPENPGRTVLAACVFPYAGENAIFSNVIDYSMAVRRVTVAGVGNAARFNLRATRSALAFGSRPSSAMLRGKRSSAAFANCRAVANCRSR